MLTEPAAPGPGMVLHPVEIQPRAGTAAWHSWRTRYVVALLCADILAAALAILACYAFRSNATRSHVLILGENVSYSTLALLSVAVWLGALALAGAYRSTHPTEELTDYRIPVVVALRLAAVAAVASFALKAELSRSLLLIYVPTLVVGALLGRWVVRRSLRAVRRRGHALIPLMLVGDEEAIRKFADHLSRDRSHGYQVVGACVPGGARSLTARGQTFPVVGSPDDLVMAARQLGAESVAVAGPAHFEELTLQQAAWRLERSGVDLMVAPDVADLAGPRIRITPLTGLPLLHITEPRLDGLSRKAKAWCERALAVPLTIILSPVLLLLAVAILVDSGRPVFYRQPRVGYRGRTFEILKFRTMVADADTHLTDLMGRNEHDGALFKIRQDPRMTRLGRWLRKYSLDELPQLFNVLKGDMVLVGPRPCRPQEMERFGPAESRRFLAHPGMTGLWQVSGRSDLPWEDAVRCDLYYVENWSPVLDLLILGRTLRVVIAGRGY
jgi:exopolysaccharide biosynthesis polyprenyl glycosylphosphotransferase